MPEIAGISRALDAQVAAGATVGCVAVVVDADGVLHESAHGLRAAGGAARMTTDSVFRLFSMTKAIGSVAALRLVDEGLLSLDDAVADILPEFARLQVFDGWDGDAPRYRAPARPVTVRHLMTHTSGLVYDIWNADQSRLIDVTGAPRMSHGRRASLPAFPLHFDPGARWEYGVSTDWLGLVVEEIAGERIEGFLKREILGPLGMGSTDVTFSPDMTARKVAVHAAGPEGWRILDADLPPTPDFFGMGHALNGSGGDYARFLRMILRGGELDGARILGPDSILGLRENAIGDLRVEPAASARPEYGGGIEFFPGVEKTWTLAFMRNEQAIPGMRNAGSIGWAGVMNTHYWIDPTAGLAGVLMMQQLPFLDAGAVAAYEAFERAVYAHVPARTVVAAA
ncbi:CubicO group peptidase, beta-lactamase class C family [Albimonas donghaensis]|uniref:CubicO group peptidase, beta-lactamase class C family n=1 Tax=Albimonas donghaensis TaxID=356660 RepID=A0A1H2W8H4_9RHOB|nr:serine hydrolase domain-containing protein [Albimonas donghaensis]SDW76841.1 CubicO group peptidase, beta-lactamase class C family [Albimonas donghaensis]